MKGLIIILGLMLATLSPVSAQSKESASWGAVQVYARCLVDQWPGVVQEITNVFPGSADYKAAIVPLSKSSCIDGAELDVPAELIRGALFQALYIKSFPDNAPALTASPLSLDNDITGQPEARAGNFKILRQYAECVVRKDPVSARTLALSASGTPSETQALAALQPALSQCLTMGNSVSFSKAVLTGLIAEVLYRLSVPSWR